MTNRNLDVAIAKLLGLNVLGEASCWLTSEDTYAVSPAGGVIDAVHSVYLRHCHCKDRQSYHAAYFKHISSCLEVVPFYHQDTGLAIKALEQVCDERELTPHLYIFSAEWAVRLLTPYSFVITQAQDKSFPLAICKALAELENKQ